MEHWTLNLCREGTGIINVKVIDRHYGFIVGKNVLVEILKKFSLLEIFLILTFFFLENPCC